LFKGCCWRANNQWNSPWYATYRSGTLTVAGLTTPSVTTVKVKANGDAGVDVTPYADKAFARSGVNLIDGTNTFIAEAQGSLGRKSTNTVSVSLPAYVTYQHDGNGNLISDGRRLLSYDDENQQLLAFLNNVEP
jgi:hypothetical protein